ncbi:MAG: hypothetical protein NVS1B10_08050 [Candidatus Saccharimonadales bacterium]
MSMAAYGSGELYIDMFFPDGIFEEDVDRMLIEESIMTQEDIQEQDKQYQESLLIV